MTDSFKDWQLRVDLNLARQVTQSSTAQSFGLIHLSKVASVNRLSTRDCLKLLMNCPSFSLVVDDDFCTKRPTNDGQSYTQLRDLFGAIFPSLKSSVCHSPLVSLLLFFCPFAYMSASPEYFSCRLLQTFAPLFRTFSSRATRWWKTHTHMIVSVIVWLYYFRRRSV